MSEARDPEEVRELLTRYFDAARTVVDRYGGVVEKFIGDAVMAVWGTPIASEEDAERAVRAALEVVDAVAALGAETGVGGLAARAGVVTGEVAVTIGAEHEGMVVGDAVNTAARIQTAASPGTVLVDATTRRLTAAAVEFEAAGRHSLKGKSRPQELWRATRVLARVGGVQRIEGPEPPLTGRDVELRLIKDLFHAAVERRSPRLLVVTGAVGVGKSRLGWEFEKYLDGLARTMWWHRGRCLSYGEGVAFWALAQAIRQRLNIAEDDPGQVASTKITAGLEELIPDEAERRFLAVRIGRLLGAPVAGDDGVNLPREELFAGWRMFFERMAAVNPVVWLIEDAQYADAGLLDFVDHLIDWSRDLPIFLLVLSRTELTVSRPGFGVGRNRSLLALDPLDTASMDALIEGLVPGMPETTRLAITAHAQGVPLFAVETIRSLLDRDIVQHVDGNYRFVGELGELAVPDTLHALLAARLDALGPSARRLVTDAAVLGASFSAEALAAVSDLDSSTVHDGLAELVRREVLEVSADPLSPERGEYCFAQHMLRQVAYETLARRDRKSKHLAVAAHLRACYADDGEEVSDLVAHHYRQALASLPDDPDVAQIRAATVEMLGRAARRAQRAGAPAAAADTFAAAANLAAADDQASAAGLWEAAADMADFAGNYERAIEFATKANELYAAIGDPRAAARALTVHGRALSNLGRLAEGREALSRAVEALRDPADRDTVRAMGELASWRAIAGDHSAEQLAREALDLAQSLALDHADLARTFTFAGIASSAAGRLPMAAAMFEYGARTAERAGDRWAQARALVNVCDVVAGFDPSYGLSVAQQALELSQAIGAAHGAAISLANLTEAMLTLGDWEGVERLLADSPSVSAYQDFHIGCFRAILAGLRGEAEAAAELGDRIGADFNTEDPSDRALISLVGAAVAHAAGDHEQTIGCAKAVVDSAGVFGIRYDSIRWAWPLAARAARALGDDETLSELVSAVDAHPAGHVPAILRAEAHLARIDLGIIARPESRLTYEQAILILRDLPAPYHLAWALLHRGRDEDLGEAAAIAERLGAAPLVAAVQAALSDGADSSRVVGDHIQHV